MVCPEKNWLLSCCVSSCPQPQQVVKTCVFLNYSSHVCWHIKSFLIHLSSSTALQHFWRQWIKLACLSHVQPLLRAIHACFYICSFDLYFIIHLPIQQFLLCHEPRVTSLHTGFCGCPFAYCYSKMRHSSFSLVLSPIQWNAQMDALYEGASLEVGICMLQFYYLIFVYATDYRNHNQTNNSTLTAAPRIKICLLFGAPCFEPNCIN